MVTHPLLTWQCTIQTRNLLISMSDTLTMPSHLRYVETTLHVSQPGVLEYSDIKGAFHSCPPAMLPFMYTAIRVIKASVHIS